MKLEATAMKAIMWWAMLMSMMVAGTTAFGKSRKLGLVVEAPLVLNYHGGPLLSATNESAIQVHLIWYGHFTPAQMAIVTDFVQSMSPQQQQPSPSVWGWWNVTQNYKYKSRYSAKSAKPNTGMALGKQMTDKECSMGTSLVNTQLASLVENAVKKGDLPEGDAVYVVLTASDVAVEDFCINNCGYHDYVKVTLEDKRAVRLPYMWVGNSEKQCPGMCAWPFHKPQFGLQTEPLVAPNGDVGADGMVMNVATLMAAVVTNPFDSGYYQGVKENSLEAVSACTGMFGKGAFPGYPGEVLKEQKTGGSYNAVGVNSRRFMVPAIWNPLTFKCTSPLGIV